MRQQLLEKTVALLEQHGFKVASFIHTNSCFDLIAHGPAVTLLLKVFANIDTLRPEHAAELRKLEHLFNAEALIVGECTKAFSLQPGVVYERHGIPVLNPSSFASLLNDQAPFVRYYKGKSIVEIDALAMRRKREESGLSLADLAERLGLARETLYRFEAGSTTSLDTAQKLEEFFHCALVKRSRFLEPVEREESLTEKELFPDHFEDELLQKIHDLGLKLAEFHRSPFDAFASQTLGTDAGGPAGAGMGEGLLISRGHKKADIQKKALDLEKSKGTLVTHSFIIAKDFKGRKVEDIPIIGEEDLDSVQKVKDLVKLIREREGRD